MNSMTLEFQVENQILSRTDNQRIVEDSVNYLYAHFTFSNDWNNTTKAIIVENKNVDLKYKVYLNDEDTCKIPNNIIDYDGFVITVIGENENSYVTITTSLLFMPVLKSNYVQAEESYVKYILSQTLNAYKDGDSYIIEIPDIYGVSLGSNEIDTVTLKNRNNEQIASVKLNFINDSERKSNQTYSSDKIEAELAARDSAIQTNANNIQANLNRLISDEGDIQQNALDITGLKETDRTHDTLIVGLRNDLTTETTNRQSANNNLQSQIDGINAGQNLADIVADLTALGNLDTTKLQSGDKVEVLNDSNHDNVSTVYNWNGTAFVYIGAYGMDSYTKAQMDAYLENKQNKIDSSHKLSSDLVDDTRHTNKFVTQPQKVKLDNAYGPNYVGEDTSTNILAKSSNTGIWKATDNNHWYYWNGTQYVDGGVYQATAIADGSINWNKLNNSVLASQLEEIPYNEIDTERFINSSGNQGDIGSNDLYYLATETNIMYVIETGVSLDIPLVYFNGTAYNGTDNIVTIVGNNTVAFINNNSSVKTLKIWKTKISNDANIINNNIIQKDITADIEIYETNRYINNAGVEGGFTGYNIYALDTKPNCKYIVKTVGNSGSTIIPHIYYNNVSYPDTRVVYFNDFGIYLITGTGLRAYINNYDSSYFSVIELSQFDLNYKLETMYTNLFKDTDYSYTENRYINSSGIQGNLTNLNLYKFYAKKGTIYHIKTYSAKVNELPFLYSNAPIPSTRPYGDYYDTYYVGNNNIVYVNGNSTYGNTVIQEFNPTNETFNIMGMFRNITCCGDSLTYSQVYTSSTTSRQALVTYPQVLGKLSGANVTQYASGGYNTQDWWNAYNENITSDNLYIIFLGTNNGLTNTVDTDCVGDDYTTYANTYTGYYGKIIRKILDNGSKCILIKCGVTSGSLQDTNNAIENLGIKFDIPVLENFISLLDDEYYHLSPTDSSYVNTVHLNDLGYAKFANYVFKAINSLSAEELYKLIV